MPKDIIKENVNFGEIIYQWEVKEYEQHERSRRWYAVMGAIGAILVIYAIISANYLFALLVVLFAIILFIHDMVEPSAVPFVIVETGIILGKKYYSFSELKNFWIIYNPPEVKNLYFSLDSVLKHRLSVPLLENDPRPIRDYLLQFVEEDLEQEEEPFSERMSRLFKI